MPLTRQAPAAAGLCALAERCGRWLIAMLFVLCACGEAFAQGQCSVQATASAPFGSGTSFVVQGTAQAAVANAVASCTGSLLTAVVVLGEPPYFRATIGGSVNDFRLSDGAGDFITYNAFADPAYSFPLTPGVAFNYYQPSVLSILGSNGGTTGHLPMHFRTVPGGNLAAGTYTDTFTINWSWKICNLGVLVCLGYTQGSGTTTVTLTLTVTSGCQITSTPDVSFGSAPTPQTFASVDQSIGVLCTKNTMTHSVGLNAGQNPSGGRRQMTNGTNVLQYDIFVGTSTVVWGAVGTERVAAPGPANGITSQLFPYRALVYPVQPNPPVGIYSDIIIVDIVF